MFRVTVDLDECGRRCCAGGEYDRRIDDVEVGLKVWDLNGGGEDERVVDVTVDLDACGRWC